MRHQKQEDTKKRKAEKHLTRAKKQVQDMQWRGHQ